MGRVQKSDKLFHIPKSFGFLSNPMSEQKQTKVQLITVLSPIPCSTVLRTCLPFYHQCQLSFLTSLSPVAGQDLERAPSSQQRRNETPGSGSIPCLLTFRRWEMCVPVRLSSQGRQGSECHPASPAQTKNLHKPSTSPGLGVPQSLLGPLVGNSEIQSFKWLPPLMMSFQKSVDETYSKRFPVNFITKGLCVDDEDEKSKYHIQIYINERILRCHPKISHLNPQDYECNEVSHP